MNINPCGQSTTTKVAWTVAFTAAPLLVALALSQIQKGNLATYLKMGAMIGGGTGLLAGVALWTVTSKSATADRPAAPQPIDEPVVEGEPVVEDEPVAGPTRKSLDERLEGLSEGLESELVYMINAARNGWPDKKQLSTHHTDLLDYDLNKYSGEEFDAFIQTGLWLDVWSGIDSLDSLKNLFFHRLQFCSVEVGDADKLFAAATTKERKQQLAVYLIGSGMAGKADKEQVRETLLYWGKSNRDDARAWLEAAIGDREDLASVRSWGDEVFWPLYQLLHGVLPEEFSEWESDHLRAGHVTYGGATKAQLESGTLPTERVAVEKSGVGEWPHGADFLVLVGSNKQADATELADKRVVVVGPDDARIEGVNYVGFSQLSDLQKEYLKAV